MSMVSHPVRLKSSRDDVDRNQSSLNSDTGNLLMRSPRALISARSLATGPACGPVRLTIQKLPISREGKPRRKPRHKPDSRAPHRTPMDSQPGHNLLTSHFQTGARGVVLAALKQHSHAHQRREVKVQLLDPAQSSSSSFHHDAQGGAECLSGSLGDAINKHLTAAAPLAQSNMEAGGSRQGDDVDRQGGASRRSQVTQQPIEALHSRQLELQNRLLESALSIVTRYTPVTSTTSDPACQRFTNMDSAVNINSSTRTIVETDPVTMATHTDQTREAHHHRDPLTVSVATQANDSHAAMEAGPAQTEAVLVRSGPEVTSMFDEASQVLRQVQQQKKVLEENLETVERVRTAEILHSQLEALIANRDESEQVRIKRTVDAWIHLISRDIQAKMEREASHRRRADASSFRLSQQRVVGSRGSAHTGRTVSLPRGTTNKKVAGSKAVAGGGCRGQTDGKRVVSTLFADWTDVATPMVTHHCPLLQAEPDPGFERLDHELYLTRLYGRAPQDNMRPSLRKSPYPPLSSLNSLTTRKPRPHLMEPVRGRGRMKQEVEQISSVSGVQVKAWNTETSLALPLNLSPGQHLPSHLTSCGPSVTPADTAIAVPLGHPRIGPSPRCRPKVTSPPVIFSSVDKAAPEPPRYQQKVTSPPVIFSVDHTVPEPPRRQQTVTSPPVIFSSVDHTAPEPPRYQQTVTSPPVIFSSVDHTAPEPPRCQQTVASPPIIFSVDHTAPESPMCQQKVTSPPVIVSSMDHTAPEPPRCQQKVTTPPVIVSSMDHTAPEPPRCSQTVTSPPIIFSVDHTAPESPRSQQKVTSPPVIVSSMDHTAPEPPSPQAKPVAADEAPSPPSAIVNVTERKNEEDAAEEDGFPGSDFLFAADVVQGEESVPTEDGGPSPTLVLHQGPVFPHQNHGVLPVHHQDSVARVDDDLVKRLVLRVEQQLMSRMISDLYRPPPPYPPHPPDPEHNDIMDQSEVEGSLTSDIVEAAGGGGLQLFVDANVPVDSGLIRQLVHEVLAEIVAQVLGQREAPDPGPRAGAEPPQPEPHTADEEKVLSLVPTPVPTPVLSPVPSIRDPLLLDTPTSSEPASLLIEDFSHPITAPEPIATPTPSPEPISSAETPPAVRQATPCLSLVDTELPLEEERPDEHPNAHTKPLVASTEEEQQPLPLAPPPPQADPQSPSSVSDDGSSSTTTGSDIALKLVSEGELLISFNQPDAMTEECSLSSSLQDMDLDPPSEGQVKGCMSQMQACRHAGTHTLQEERPQGVWRREDELSVGEVPHAHRECVKSTTPEQVAQITPCAADATNDSLNMTSDLHSQPSPSRVSPLEDTHTAGQVIQFRGLSTTQTGQQEVSSSTCVPPEKISSDDSSDLF
ncbi:protein TALPID3 isoform X3 [Dunckerocampus dactyliophorus]|uniref:protein TALPID3 isoform X3 n=1 Tax=Dunckerocampus dactyliophorus TaxID=161453 RepID=UPI002407270E|nr:protein TALPID3 isoform X3 [Dunckerocampus dactyliophorus]